METDKYRELYQHLCDAQDLAESLGMLQLMYAIDTLRQLADSLFYKS